MDGDPREKAKDIATKVGNAVRDVAAKAGLTNKPRFDIDSPRWDQSSYSGRVNHFIAVTNPLNLLKTDDQLAKAKDVVERFRKGEDMSQYTDDYIWEQKHIVDSAFHPDTGEKLMIIGRMSCQVPYNTVISTLMMVFYKSKVATIFWQWVNQTVNAIVNYSNRSGGAEISKTQVGTAYVLATAGGIGTSLGLNSALKNAPAIIGKCVPFTAVAASNAINIPAMRFAEIQKGTPVSTEDGKEVGISKVAGRMAIGKVLFSRIVMAAPGMLLTPVVVSKLEKGFLKKYRFMNIPTQVGLCALFLSISTPMGCAIWPQKCPISVTELEPELQEKIKKMGDFKTVYFNKGL